MTNLTTTETQQIITATTEPRPPDGTLHMKIDNQPFIVEVFFNPNSTETFQDKLLRVILAEELRDFDCKRL